MYRALMIAALALAALSACTNEPEAPQTVAVAVTAPQESADKEVLIASQPTGAKVLLQGAEVGATPMKLLIRGDTNVVLEKDGYVRQALMLTQKSDPNVVVTLVPSTEPQAVAVVAPEAAAPEAAAADQRPSSGKSSSRKGSEKAEDKSVAAAPQPPDVPAQPEPAAAATPAPAQPEPAKATPAPAAPKKTEYANMRQLKDALRAGAITRDEYASWQATIRKNRQAEYDATEKDLRDGKITESQYKDKIRAIRAKYEG